MTRLVLGVAAPGWIYPVILLWAQALTVGGAAPLDNVVRDDSLHTPAHYGVVYLFPHGAWSDGDIRAAEEEFRQISMLGVDTIIQTYAIGDFSEPYRRGWLAFLDLAAANGIDVIAYPWPNRVYGGPNEPFDLTDLKAFLDVTAGHTALTGVLVLHEPLEPQLGISAEDLRRLYAELKAYAPQLQIAHYLNNISRAEALRPDGWRFSDGMCDICIVWYYPSVLEAGMPVFRIDDVERVVTDDLALIRERDPDAELWFLGQAFENLDYPTPLRFPTPDEMRAIYEVANQQAIDGLLWYAWNQSDIYGSVLSDDDRAANQAMVGWLASTHIYRHKRLLPLLMADSRSRMAVGTAGRGLAAGASCRAGKVGHRW